MRIVKLLTQRGVGSWWLNSSGGWDHLTLRENHLTLRENHLTIRENHLTLRENHLTIRENRKTVNSTWGGIMVA